MKKKWLISIGFALAIALLTMPLSGLSSQAKGNDKVIPNQVKLVSGGLFPGGIAVDGIILGGPCTPDVHDFDLHSTIVFITGVQSNALQSTDDVSVYVEIKSNGQKLLEVPLVQEGEEAVDFRDGTPLWIKGVHVDEVGLPTGEYNYSFKVKAAGDNGHVLDVWVPQNHKFTITDTD